MHKTTIRFTDEQWEAVQKEAAKNGVSAAQYIRNVVAKNTGTRDNPTGGVYTVTDWTTNVPVTLTGDQVAEVVAEVRRRRGGKIHAIKYVRSVTNCGLREALECVTTIIEDLEAKRTA